MFEKFVDWIMCAGMPLVYAYQLFCGNIFLNTCHEDASGLEKIGNELLTPFHYIFVGSKVSSQGTEKQIFHYRNGDFVIKTLVSTALLPVGVTLGTACKGLSYLSPITRSHHHDIVKSRAKTNFTPNEKLYKQWGIEVGNYLTAESLPPPEYQRRPGDELHMGAEQEAFKQVVELLTEAKIPFWVDCGTLLGTQRYGGVIPWDQDMDIGILQVDSKSVAKVLQKLDSSRFIIQDWASRDKPGTYLKVYIRETGRLIDIYHFVVQPKKRMMHTICSNIDCMFMLERWKVRESRYTRPVPLDYIFPLKQGVLDGIVVPVPNQTVKYLQHHYGENIEPAKVYNEKTGAYEKDLSHPYWDIPYAH